MQNLATLSFFGANLQLPDIELTGMTLDSRLCKDWLSFCCR